MASFQLKINGTLKTVQADEDTPLLWILRDNLQLVGTKYGCGIAQCGACTVHLDGTAVRACSIPISSIKKDQNITTIEGLSEDGSHPLQSAWIEHDVPQCGYCQSGQIMHAAAFLKDNKLPTLEEISEAMHANICRCGTYPRINQAILSASKSYK